MTYFEEMVTMFPKTVDITEITGIQIIGPPTNWQTQNGPFNVEHVAAVSSSNNLIVFWWSPQHDWQAVNVSKITGVEIVDGLTNWRTHDGTFLVEHIAGRTPEGDLIEFSWSPEHDWQAVNVSEITGRRIIASPTSWVTPYLGEPPDRVTPDGATPDEKGGIVQHLTASGLEGGLLEGGIVQHLAAHLAAPGVEGELT